MKFTAKKIIRNKKELSTLFKNLEEKGYRWGNGTNLESSHDTEYCLNHIPILLAFDAKNKKVYYSTFLHIDIGTDPNYR